jgi:hypothetical protein
MLFDYENCQEVSNLASYYYTDEMVEENYLEVTVYNLEVEDFHTYYVGETGFCVHDHSSGAKRR